MLRFIMESGAKGCEIVVSGKLRGQRAKSMKFVDGLMIHTGNPTRDYIDKACTHVLLRQGVSNGCVPDGVVEERKEALGGWQECVLLVCTQLFVHIVTVSQTTNDSI